MDGWRTSFFMHPTSMTLWRAFPWVIEIDATYKTNVYNMPHVEIFGVTSTGRTFSLAYAFIVNEQEANYQWVLQSLKSTLVEGFVVRVVLTDREQALMKALKVVMPEAKHLLCRFHIWQNITKHCKPALRLKDVDIEKLHIWWRRVYESWTIDKFKSYEKELKKKLTDFPAVYSHTTNRVDVEHHLLKEELKGKCTFTRTLHCVDSVMIGQETEIRGQLRYSKGTMLGKHNYKSMKALLGKVSHKALDIMADEIIRLDKQLKKQVKKCGCKVQFSCGLPCAYKIPEYMQRETRIQPNMIDLFWRKLDLTLSTCLPGNDHLKDGDDVEAVHEVLGEIMSFLVSDLNKNPHGLRKSKSSRPRPEKVPMTPPFTDPYSGASTYGEAQPTRQSEYAPTKSRFVNTHDFFNEPQGARHSMYEPT
uniref:uncharacterized protein LOC122609128 n=1 Tax=Erigeron canadensis TaxID=72917 RepID=UPI001CB95DBC|nr:uncharacterized protein LOC122609128 [Erigeron canadensis]